MTNQIVPKWVNPAKPGKKYGSVVDQNDQRYPVAASFVNLFQKGVAANIVFDEQRWGQDMVKVVTYINGQDITGQAGPVHGGDRPAPTPQNVPPKPQSDYEEQKAENIFLCGVVNHAIEAGACDMNNMPAWVGAALRAWRDRDASAQLYRQEQASGMAPGDEIPDWVTQNEGR